MSFTRKKSWQPFQNMGAPPTTPGVSMVSSTIGKFPPPLTPSHREDEHLAKVTLQSKAPRRPTTLLPVMGRRHSNGLLVWMKPSSTLSLLPKQHLHQAPQWSRMRSQHLRTLGCRTLAPIPKKHCHPKQQLFTWQHMW
eukprot:2602067-Amphidinium_carterae.1